MPLVWMDRTDHPIPHLPLSCSIELGKYLPQIGLPHCMAGCAHPSSTNSGAPRPLAALDDSAPSMDPATLAMDGGAPPTGWPHHLQLASAMLP